MNKWGKKSLAHFRTLHPDLQVLADEVLAIHDCSIFQGYRDKETQNKYFDNKTSKVKFPFSKHNKDPSEAIDLAPYIPGGDPYDMERVLFFAGIVRGVADRLHDEGSMEFRLKWGGAWSIKAESPFGFDNNKFFDGIHWELQR
jgi:peptidoglycan L-alanyl-D-glutamate endopeptidase CwlK